MSKKIQQKTNMTTLAATLVKSRGRGKTPTSVLVFDLDEKSVEYILGEHRKLLVRNLYEKSKGGCKLIFISKFQSVLNRLEEALPFKIETQLLKDKSQNRLKDEVMKIVLQYATDKIKPQASTYIGTLFEKEGLSRHAFKFGSVLPPHIYFSSLVLSKQSQDPDESMLSLASPIKGGEACGFEHKDMKLLDESFADLGKCNSMADQIDNSFSSNHKFPLLLNESFELNTHDQDNIMFAKQQEVKWNGFQKMNEEQDQLRKELPLLYTKIKDLNNRISGKLCSKLDQLKNKQSFLEDDRGIKSPVPRERIPLSVIIEPNSQIGKRMKNFEDDMFNDYVKDAAGNVKTTDDGIFDISNRVTMDLGLKIRNINFEVQDECDARPISKKLKKPEVRAGKENNESGTSNQVILEYKTSIPGEKPTIHHIYQRDIQKLEPNSYINDTIIYFYLKLVQNEFLENDKKSNFYIFNSYLMEKLKPSKDKADKTTLDEQGFDKVYNNVKKWTKDIDIFEKDFLLFPVNDKEQKHWSLYVVCYPKYLLVKEEPSKTNEEHCTGKSFILCFDSLKLMDHDTAGLIARYLQREVMNKKPEIYNMIKDHFNSITTEEYFQVIAPLQDNYSDCGLYVLEYAERFMLDHAQILNNIQENANKLHLFPRSIFKTKREDVANIILGLAKGQKSVLSEYQEKKKQRMKEAVNDPNEFDEIPEEDLKNFINEACHETFEAFPAHQRDTVKVIYLINLNEAKLPGSGEFQNKV